MKKKDATPANQINKMLGFYDYKELLPFAGRIGAMDAFKLPSVIGQNRFFRKDAERLK